MDSSLESGVHHPESAEPSWEKGGLLYLGPLCIGEVEADINEWAQLDYRDACGPFGGGGRMVYAVNRDGSRSMNITVRCSYYYQGQSRSQTANYIVSPSQSVYVGCTRPGEAPQTFDYSILSAVYI